MPSLLTLIEVGLWVATAVQTVFVVLYGFLTPWYTEFVGRALFLKSTVVWLALCNSLVSVYWMHPYQLETAVALTALLGVAICYQCAALIERLWFDKPVHRPEPVDERRR